MKVALRMSLTLLFCVILILCLAPAVSAETVAYGECGAQGDNLTWTLDDGGTLTISGEGAMADYSQGSAPWYGKRLSISSMTIEDNVASVGNYAFYGCSGLTDVTIPSSVTSIGSSALQRCTALTSVTIMEGVMSIGVSAFQYCTGLTSVTIPEGVTSIGDSAFYGCSSLMSVTIPGSVTSIGNITFHGCSSLINVTIPGSVTSIGNVTFFGCSSLTSLTISEGVTSIGDSAFSDCSSLTSVTIPKSVTSIGDSAFSDCSSLTSVTIPEGVTSVGDSAFHGSSLTRVTIPSSLTSFGRAFYGCSKLTEIKVNANNPNYCDVDGVVFDKDIKILIEFPYGREGDYVIPNGVTSFGRAFYGCSNLTSVTIPEGVMSIGESAFQSCSSLTSVTIPGSVKSIGFRAFCGCSSLTSVTILEGVTSIGVFAFEGCSSLTSVTIPESVTSIGRWAFQECFKLDAVYITDIVAWCNCSISDLGYSTAHPEPYTISLYLNGVLVTDLRIPGSITSIGNYAFQYCSSLTSVTIPESVTYIGECAFEYCSNLTSLTIPEGVTSIGNYAFSNCSSLAVVYYGGTENQWNSISVGDYNQQLLNALRFYNGETPALCMVTFKPNGGSGSSKEQIIPEGTPTALKTANSLGFRAPSGLSFRGWNTEADGSGAAYADGDTVTLSGDLTLYARWAGAEMVTVYFDKNNAAAIGFIEPQTVKAGNSFTLSPNAFTCGKCFFDGWNTKPDGTGVAYSDGAWLHVSGFAKMTLYAQWLAPDLVLPASLTAIEREAFVGGAFRYAVVPETVSVIGYRAFAECTNLRYIEIQGMTTEIDPYAFVRVKGLTILGKSGSTAEDCAWDHDFTFIAVS